MNIGRHLLSEELDRKVRLHNAPYTDQQQPGQGKGGPAEQQEETAAAQHSILIVLRVSTVQKCIRICRDQQLA